MAAISDIDSLGPDDIASLGSRERRQVRRHGELSMSAPTKSPIRGRSLCEECHVHL